MTQRALIVVDVQNDFTDIEGAALPVEGGAALAGRISDYMAQHAKQYDAIVATRDWHIEPGDHFADEPDYVDTWPPHCVADTKGAAFHPDLDTALVDRVFSKGNYSASYTGFDGRDPAGRSLADWLADNEIDAVDVVGIATDYCVRATALDATAVGFSTRVLPGLAVGIEPDTTQAALDELAAAGVELADA